MRGGIGELLGDLRAAGSIALARKARMRLRTPEKVFGVPPSSFKAVLAGWSRREGGPPARPELAELFGSGVFEARLAAVEISRRCRKDWDAGWTELFLAWAKASDVSWRVADSVGADLLGPLLAEGRLPAGSLEDLAASPSVWPWRAGMAALGPSLERDGLVWPVFESFARSCVGEGSRFGRERAALNGLRSALRRARKGCPDLVRDYLVRHEPDLPGLLETLEGGADVDQGG
ncbi:MAG: DNA alkylation repair protein [Elusimicrobia bacterium]|nr:DNA alkylation repair protein [Elusimicrobiota bacterium]